MEGFIPRLINLTTAVSVLIVYGIGIVLVAEAGITMVKARRIDWLSILGVVVVISLMLFGLQVLPAELMKSTTRGIENMSEEAPAFTGALRGLLNDVASPLSGETADNPSSAVPTEAAPEPTPTLAPTTTPQPTPEHKTYTAQPGDTIQGIIAACSMTRADFEAYNGSLSELVPGQQVIIPGGCTVTTQAQPTETPPPPTATIEPTPTLFVCSGENVAAQLAAGCILPTPEIKQ